MYQFRLYFRENYVFWINFRLFAPPYFNHDAFINAMIDAFMNHALHALDAPACQ